MKLFVIVLLVFAATASAAPPRISQARLDSIVRHWQRVLILQDWDIRAFTERLENLPVGTWGASHLESGLRVVQIGVLDPQDYERAAAQNGTVLRRGKAILADIEDTIVHELVHLRLRDLMKAPDGEALHMAEEMTVNRITGALLRGGR